jgi:hypothetical protein
MNRPVRYLILCLVAMAYLPAVAVIGSSMPAAVTPQDKAKTDLLAKFRKNSTGDLNAQKTAAEAGKEYLTKYPSDKDPAIKEITDWIATYESELKGVDVLNKVYRDKKYAEAFAPGKQFLTAEPDNIKVLTALGYAGLFSAAGGKDENSADATTYAKKAIQLIEEGKAPTDWKPFKSKDETLGWLNYALGLMNARTNGPEAIVYFTKAAQLEGAPKTDPTVYYYLATLLELDYNDLRDGYSKTYSGKPETAQSKAAMEAITAKIDRIVDSYARLIAYMDADPAMTQRFQSQRAGWMEKLTTFYKFRHNNSDSGLKEMVAEIRSKPMAGQETGLTAKPLSPTTTP